MQLRLRYMRVEDVPHVLAIDRVSFDPAWSARSYHFEIKKSEISYMPVLVHEEDRPVDGMRKLLNSLRGQRTQYEETSIIVGYGGLWKMSDESHISTIATHPEHRGKGYGEILLAGMLRRAIALKAAYTVLEVRVSNTVARKLYLKYHFTIAGVKPNYYSSNNEDAYDMRLDLTDRETLAHIDSLYDALQARVAFIDQYSHTLHPRLGH